jgi:hypothetical protein
MRDYIARCLTRGESSYFSKPVIAPLPRPLDFASLRGKSEYDRAVAALFAASAQGWLTPSEIFAPHYSRAVAHWFLSATPPRAPLRVFEVGGGSGAHAVNALDHVRAVAPARYATASYTILEASARLCGAQAAAIERAGHGGVARSVHTDALRLGELPELHTREPCVVVALEVLDNLPHDKVVCIDGALHEARVKEDAAGGGRGEAYAPLADATLAATWAAMEAYGRAGWAPWGGGASLLSRAARALPPLPRVMRRGAFAHLPPPPRRFQWALCAPTGAFSLLRAVRGALPNARLLLADFAALPLPVVAVRGVAVTQYAPPAPLPGCGGPAWGDAAGRARWGANSAASSLPLALGGAAAAPLIVASKFEFRGEDHATYLTPPPGDADILFPTDFGLLARLAGPSARVHTNAEFMRQFAQAGAGETRTGYNPLLEDFRNTMVLVA